MAGNIAFRVEGLDTLLDKARPGKLFEEAALESLHEIGKVGEASARQGAPRGKTGRTAARMSYKVSARPRWVVVKTDAAAPYKGGRPNPYPYPRRLEFDPKSRHQNWLKSALDRARPRIQQIVSDTASRIERGWSF